MSASLQFEPRQMTPKLWDEVINSGPCHYCGHGDPSEVEHVIPVSRGGGDDRENLVPACLRCNQQKASMTPSEWRAWREERGMSWPPGNVLDWRWLTGVVEWLFAVHPDQAEELYAQQAWCGWDHHLHERTARMVHSGKATPETVGSYWLSYWLPKVRGEQS